MPTRFYFPASTAADVTPAFDAGWHYAGEAVRRKLVNTKGASAITVGTQIGPWTTNNQALDRQYISDGMSAGINFTLATTMKAQLMCREYNNGDNVTDFRVRIKIVSNDGSTVRCVLMNTLHQQSTEFINNATHRNTQFSASTPLGTGVITGTYTTVAGDRLVVELGYGDNTGATPEASAKWGENATDLPENQTQTTDGAGWIEFSNTITFSNSYTMTATTQGFTFSGTAANLKKGFLIVAATTNFVFSGTDSTFNKGFRVTADTTAFNLTGQTTGLRTTRKISADSSTYVLSGTDNSLEKGLKVSADNGAFVLTGQDTSLEQGRKVSADNGSFVLSGTDATLIYTEAGNYTIPADNGSFLLNGTSSSLEVGRKVSTDSGAFVFTGQDATLTYEQSGGYTMPANSGTFSFSGTNTSLLYKRIMEAGNGSYVMTGTPVTLTKASESTIGMVKIKFGYSVRANPNYNKYKR
jgi:hypothetical protein